MTTGDLKLGQMVFSKKGRDQGKPFIVYELIDNLFVYLVDGDKRRTDNPKRKNIKHIQRTSFIVEEINAKLSADCKIKNSEIRQALSAWESSREKQSK